MKKSQTTKAPAVDLKLLENPPENSVLLVKNLYRGMVSLHIETRPGGGVVIPRMGEIILKPEEVGIDDLVSALRRKMVTAEWVEKHYEIHKVPNPEDAPPELQVDDRTMARFALGIAMADDREALQLIDTDVHAGESGEIDVPYMRNSFAKVLKLGAWCETGLRNRPKIHAAIKSALRKIQDM